MSDDISESVTGLIEMPVEAFNIFALVMPCGPNYNGGKLISAWADAQGLGYGGVIKMGNEEFTVVILRRR